MKKKELYKRDIVYYDRTIFFFKIACIHIKCTSINRNRK